MPAPERAHVKRERSMESGGLIDDSDVPEAPLGKDLHLYELSSFDMLVVFLSMSGILACFSKFNIRTAAAFCINLAAVVIVRTLRVPMIQDAALSWSVVSYASLVATQSNASGATLNFFWPIPFIFALTGFRIINLLVMAFFVFIVHLFFVEFTDALYFEKKSRDIAIIIDVFLFLVNLFFGIVIYMSFFVLGQTAWRLRKHPEESLESVPLLEQTELRTYSQLPMGLILGRSNILSEEQHLLILLRLSQHSLYRDLLLQIMRPTEKELNHIAELDLTNVTQIERQWTLPKLESIRPLPSKLQTQKSLSLISSSVSSPMGQTIQSSMRTSLSSSPELNDSLSLSKEKTPTDSAMYDGGGQRYAFSGIDVPVIGEGRDTEFTNLRQFLRTALSQLVLELHPNRLVCDTIIRYRGVHCSQQQLEAALGSYTSRRSKLQRIGVYSPRLKVNKTVMRLWASLDENQKDELPSNYQDLLLPGILLNVQRFGAGFKYSSTIVVHGEDEERSSFLQKFLSRIKSTKTQRMSTFKKTSTIKENGNMGKCPSNDNFTPTKRHLSMRKKESLRQKKSDALGVPLREPTSIYRSLSRECMARPDLHRPFHISICYKPVTERTTLRAHGRLKKRKASNSSYRRTKQVLEYRKRRSNENLAERQLSEGLDLSSTAAIPETIHLDSHTRLSVDNRRSSRASLASLVHGASQRRWTPELLIAVVGLREAQVRWVSKDRVTFPQATKEDFRRLSRLGLAGSKDYDKMVIRARLARASQIYGAEETNDLAYMLSKIPLKKNSENYCWGWPSTCWRCTKDCLRIPKWIWNHLCYNEKKTQEEKSMRERYHMTRWQMFQHCLFTLFTFRLISPNKVGGHTPSKNLSGTFRDLKVERWYLTWSCYIESFMIVKMRTALILLTVVEILLSFGGILLHYLISRQQESVELSEIIFFWINCAICVLQIALAIRVFFQLSPSHFGGHETSHLIKLRAATLGFVMLVLSFVDYFMNPYNTIFNIDRLTNNVFLFIIAPLCSYWMNTWPIMTKGAEIKTIKGFLFTYASTASVMEEAETREEALWSHYFSLFHQFMPCLIIQYVIARAIQGTLRKLFCRSVFLYIFYLDALSPMDNEKEEREDENPSAKSETIRSVESVGSTSEFADWSEAEPLGL